MKRKKMAYKNKKLGRGLFIGLMCLIGITIIIGAAFIVLRPYKITLDLGDGSAPMTKIYTVNDNEFSYNYNTLKEIFNDNDNNSLFKEDNTIDFKELYERLDKKFFGVQKKNNRKSKYDTKSVNSITNNTKISF